MRSARWALPPTPRWIPVWKNDKICEKRAHASADGQWAGNGHALQSIHTCNACRDRLYLLLWWDLCPITAGFFHFYPCSIQTPPLLDCSSMRTFPFHVLLLIISLWIASIDWRNSIARLDLWHWWLKIDGRWNRLRLLSSEVLIDVVYCSVSSSTFTLT